MLEIKFPFHKYYLFGCLFSTKVKDTHTDQKTFQVFFYSVQIETTHKPWKEAAGKILFLDATCFDECFYYLEG